MGVSRERERDEGREMPGDGAVFTGDVSKLVFVSVTQLA